MKVSEHVICAIDDAGVGKLDSALLHACLAIDATSRRLYRSRKKVGVRYVDCLRHYYWVVEPMIGAGLNLVETRFSNIRLRHTSSPDLAEIVYEIFRCHHAHGDEVPLVYAFTRSEGAFRSQWVLSYGHLHMPDRLIWALLAVAVFSRANKSENTAGTYFLSLGAEQFLVCDWWGREDDFRLIADRHNKIRVKLEGLERW